MKILVAQSELSHALRLVSRAVGSGRTHPILAGVLLQAADGQLRITAYDLDLGISTSIAAVVEAAGATVVPHRLLADIAGRLDGSEALSLAVDGARVTLTASSGSYSLSVASADDFPALPAVDAAAGAPVDLSGALAAVMPAVATDASKMLLTGIHLRSAGGTLQIEATDGHRLASRSITADLGDLDVIVPARTLQQVRQPARLAVSNRQAAIVLADGTTIISGTLEGTYPNVQALIPATFAQVLTVNRLSLLHALERVAVIADSHNSVVKLQVDDMALKVGAEAESNSGSELIACDGKLPTLAANVHYLIDGIKGISGDTLSIKTNTATTPVVFTSATDADSLYLVMPVQVR